MTEQPLDPELAARLRQLSEDRVRAQVQAAKQRRAQQDAARREFAASRTAGLRSRHAAKQARLHLTHHHDTKEPAVGNHPSIIARPTATGWEGRYVHNDGHPNTRIDLLLDLYHRSYRRDLTAMTEFLIDAHPAGWSQFGNDPTADTGWIRPGTRTTAEAVADRSFRCYCHGDRHDTPELNTDANTKPVIADWVYVLRPDGIEVIKASEDGEGWQSGGLVPWNSRHYAERAKDEHELLAEQVIAGAITDATSRRAVLGEGAIDDGIRALLHHPSYENLSGNHISLICALGDYAAKAVVAFAEASGESAKDMWVRLSGQESAK